VVKRNLKKINKNFRPFLKNKNKKNYGKKKIFINSKIGKNYFHEIRTKKVCSKMGNSKKGHAKVVLPKS